MHALVNFPTALQTMAKPAESESAVVGKGAGQSGAESLVMNLGAIVWTAPLLVIGLLLLGTIKPADIARKLGGPPGETPFESTESQQRGY